MLELTIKAISDFVMFSFLEGILYSMYYNLCCDCKKFKIWQIIIMSVGNCLISTFLSLLLYQVIMLLWMSGLLYFINNKKLKFIKYMKYVFNFMLIMLVCETLPIVFIEKISGYFNIKIMYDNYIFYVLIKLIELIVIIILKRRIFMKTWWAEIKKRK
jgi:hypothetical protein